MKQTVVNMKNTKVGEVELPDAVFSVKPNTALLYEAVKMQLANRRFGNASTLNCGAVSGSTKKIYKQKGTGQARHGSRKHNIFVGGGVAFGPRPRDYSYEMPKKARRGALRAALAQKYADGKLVVIDRWELPQAKTKHMAHILKAFGVAGVLLVLEQRDENIERSARNLPGVSCVESRQLAVLDLMNHDHVIFTKNAVEQLNTRVVI